MGTPGGERESEAQVLERLRAAYEAKGFSVVLSPDSRDLPDFLDGYRPGALARKPGVNVAIAVMRRTAGDQGRPLADIRRRIADQPDWRLDVVYINADQPELVEIPAVPAEAIRPWMGEVGTLAAGGHTRAAFLLAWSLLEAAAGALGSGDVRRPRMARQIVQALAADGHIGLELERQLWRAADLRNRIAHGDLSVEATAEDVDTVLAAIRQTLTSGAA